MAVIFLHDFHYHVWRLGTMFTSPPPVQCWFDQPANVDSGMGKRAQFHRPSWGWLFDYTLLSHGKKNLRPQTVHQVKPTMPSPELTNEGLGRGPPHQLRCQCSGSTRTLTSQQNKQWACGVEFKKKILVHTQVRHVFHVFRSVFSHVWDRYERRRAPSQHGRTGSFPSEYVTTVCRGSNTCGTSRGDWSCNCCSYQPKGVASWIWMLVCMGSWPGFHVHIAVCCGSSNSLRGALSGRATNDSFRGICEVFIEESSCFRDTK